MLEHARLPSGSAELLPVCVCMLGVGPGPGPCRRSGVSSSLSLEGAGQGISPLLSHLDPGLAA